MSSISALAKIQWDKTIKYGPIILDMAERIYNNVKEALGGKPQPSATVTAFNEISMAALADRVAQLEANELQQAELISIIARQGSDFLAALQIVSKRVLLLSILSSLALLLSVVSIAIALMK